MSELQRTQAWLQERAGRVTASEIYKLVIKRKDGKPSAMRAGYRGMKVAERRCGRSCEREFNKSQAMLDGIDREEQARALYALTCYEPVTECGFIVHPHINWSGASPDALVGERGLVQIKSPEWEMHLAALKGDEIKTEYLCQMQWEMACCAGREWCDYVSYHPDWPEDEQMVTVRVSRDDVRIAELEREVMIFLAEVDAEIELLDRRRMLRKAAA
jgi:hypothetical protein